jgi:hypothetical protein
MAESPPAPAAAPTSLSEYTGYYRQHTSAWSITAGLERLFDGRRVTEAGGRLVLGSLLGDVPDTLEALGEDRFRTGNGPGADVVFLRSPQGAVTGLATWDSENIRAGNYERSSRLAAWAPLLVLVLSIPLMLSTLLVIPIRSGIAWARRRGSVEDPWARWLPALAVLSLVGAAMVLGVGVSQPDGLLVLASPGATAVGFWALTSLFALLSGASLLVTTTGLVRGPARLARTYSFLVALSCVAVAIFLATWGVLGLRTWTW